MSVESSTLSTSNDTVASMNVTLDCPHFSLGHHKLIENVNFWVQGVTVTAMSVFGILANALFAIILAQRDLRNSFNLLLICLSVFDSSFLMGAILESVRTVFKSASNLHIYLFPYLLHPGRSMAMSGSIFMTVAISFERYVAVHNPIDYNLAMNDPRATKRRVAKFLIPVVLLTILFSITKFFDAQVVYETLDGIPASEAVKRPGFNSSQLVPKIHFTEFRVNPKYVHKINWSRLLFLGVIPVALLIYFNWKIYLDIKERKRRRQPKTQFELSVMLRNDMSRSTAAGIDGGGGGGGSVEEATTEVVEVETGNGNLSNGETRVVHPHHHNNNNNNNMTQQLSSSENSNNNEVAQMNFGRRIVEDKMALLFMGIVFGFLVCNFPRIYLNFHEIIILDHAMACYDSGANGFPLWFWITSAFSELFLVINSSFNMFIYCLFNKKFRDVVKNLFAKYQKCIRDFFKKQSIEGGGFGGGGGGRGRRARSTSVTPPPAAATAIGFESRTSPQQPQDSGGENSNQDAVISISLSPA